MPHQTAPDGDLSPRTDAPLRASRLSSDRRRGTPFAARAFDAVLELPGHSARAVARAFGCVESVVRALRNGEGPVHLGDLYLMAERPETRAVALDLLDRVRRDLEPAATTLSLERRALLVTREIGDVARALSEALADGCVDDAERRTITSELTQARAQLEAMQRDLDSG